MTETAVVCVNYASSGHVEQLLESLRSVDVAEIVVWDNFSTEDERARLTSITAKHPRVRVELADENLGFGPAVNRAVDLVSDRVDQLWVLNPDVTVEVDALNELTRSRIEHACAIISPLVLAGEGSSIWYAGGEVLPAKGRTVHRLIGRDQTEAEPYGYRAVTFITGAAMLITRDAWNKLGGFREQFFLYCEDADLSIRAAQLGLHMGVETKAIARHSEGGSSGGSSRAKSETFYYYVQRNRLVLYSAFSSRAQLLFGQGALETIRLLVHPVMPLRHGASRRLRASVTGLLHGLRGDTGPRDRTAGVLS